MAGTYRHEIESLHDFFVEWYTAQADDAAFGRLEDALGPSFEIVSPDGTISSREDILSAIRRSYDTHEVGAFDIQIQNVDTLAEYDDAALVRYEEWQDTPDGTTGRLSTVLFELTGTGEADAGSFEWRHVQETWLEQPDG